MNEHRETIWRGQLKNGSMACETSDVSWDEIKDELVSLELVGENVNISLPRGKEYVQAKTCSANLLNGNCEIESRYIGFKNGDMYTIARVNEKTKRITIEQI